MKNILITIAAVLLVGCGPSPNELINKAAGVGDIEAVKQHLADGVDVNARNDVKSTPLHYAIGNGHKEVVELLIAKGADVNAVTMWGGTPLCHARGDETHHLEIAKLLIAEGADMTVNGNVDRDTLLHSVKDRAIAKLLIDKGADVNARNVYGFTPLDQAYSNGYRDVADLIRKHGGKSRF